MDVEEGSRPTAGAEGPAGRAAPDSPLAAAVFDTMPVGAALWTPAGRLRHANPVLCGLLATELDELRGVGLHDLVPPDERRRVDAQLGELRSGARNAFECRLTERVSWPLRAHVAAAYGPDGKVAGLVLQVFDFGPAEEITLPQGLATVLEEGSDFLLTARADGSLSYGNRSARSVLGVGLEDGPPPTLADVLEPDSLEYFHEVVEPVLREEGSWQGELTFRTRENRPVPVSARLVAHRTDVEGGALGAVSLFARDITELKSAERRLRQLATHDYLTGLPNRLLLYDRLELALNRYTRYGTPVALMFCDLDGFKPVNDAYGHQVGDAVLMEVADRIHSVVRDTDTAARLGGDEFAVLVEGVDDLDLLTAVAERLVAAIAEPVQVGGAVARDRGLDRAGRGLGALPPGRHARRPRRLRHVPGQVGGPGPLRGDDRRGRLRVRGHPPSSSSIVSPCSIRLCVAMTLAALAGQGRGVRDRRGHHPRLLGQLLDQAGGEGVGPPVASTGHERLVDGRGGQPGREQRLHGPAHGQAEVDLGHAPVAPVGAHDDPVVGRGQQGARAERVPVESGDGHAGEGEQAAPHAEQLAQELVAVLVALGHQPVEVQAVAVELPAPRGHEGARPLSRLDLVEGPVPLERGVEVEAVLPGVHRHHGDVALPAQIDHPGILPPAAGPRPWATVVVGLASGRG